MKPQSLLAIYILFWTISLFVVLPFGVRTAEEAGVECQPGHAPSAPHNFSFAKAALRATIVSAVAFAIFLANYHFGWVTIAMLEWAKPPGQ
jgi:predicted secreted protein